MGTQGACGIEAETGMISSEQVAVPKPRQHNEWQERLRRVYWIKQLQRHVGKYIPFFNQKAISWTLTICKYDHSPIPWLRMHEKEYKEEDIFSFPADAYFQISYAKSMDFYIVFSGKFTFHGFKRLSKVGIVSKSRVICETVLLLLSSGTMFYTVFSVIGRISSCLLVTLLSSYYTAARRWRW